MLFAEARREARRVQRARHVTRGRAALELRAQEERHQRQPQPADRQGEHPQGDLDARAGARQPSAWRLTGLKLGFTADFGPRRRGPVR